MSEIVLEIQNPRDLNASEVEPFAAELRTAFPDANVRISSKETRRRVHAVTLEEVLKTWVPVGVSIVKVLEIFVTWARNRHRTTNSRPKSITIYGADGRPLKSVVVRGDNEKEEERPLDSERITPPAEGSRET